MTTLSKGETVKVDSAKFNFKWFKAIVLEIGSRYIYVKPLFYNTGEEILSRRWGICRDRIIERNKNKQQLQKHYQI